MLERNSASVVSLGKPLWKVNILPQDKANHSSQGELSNRDKEQRTHFTTAYNILLSERVNGGHVHVERNHLNMYKYQLVRSRYNIIQYMRYKQEQLSPKGDFSPTRAEHIKESKIRKIKTHCALHILHTTDD